MWGILHRRNSAQSGRNEHIKKLKRKESMSVFHQLMIEKHSGTEQALSIHLLGTCPNDAVLRQVAETTYIHTKNPGLNAKEEWGNVPRTRFDQGSDESNLINNWQAIDSIHELTDEAADGRRNI